MPLREYVDLRTAHLRVPPAAAFAPIQRIGGQNGWYYANWLWRLRGALDVAVGGPGMRPGRRDPKAIAPGDRIDWWEVELFEPGHRLRLFSHMKVPGTAWLEFEVEPNAGGSLIRQTARFRPSGILGRIYWFGLLPVHDVVFSGLLRALGRAATSGKRSGVRPGQDPGWAGAAAEDYDSPSD